VTGSTPLVEFFKRGEVDRDARLLAARGALSPHAHEQLALLVVLIDDDDEEVRALAEQTLASIPKDELSRYLARSDVPSSLRTFFANRGVHPADVPSAGDQPLIHAASSSLEGVESAAVNGPEEGAPVGGDRESLVQQLAKMSMIDKLKMAVKGSREARATLIRDAHKMVAVAVLSSPKLTDSEVESFARMTNVCEEVLRTIGTNRAWTKNYSVVAALTKNAKTPLAVSLNLLSRLLDRDVTLLASDRNVPEPLRIAARKRLQNAESRR
jgi:alkanesulfonate monooxygenase SsuD/methylene tetrahydromethanopterin reductase-like flavin-dependent oxidoreductase (luciferase family)